uniref:Uncharacterized protein n=1 Tax=Chenopodium quinoa TaxID=63459 RepID=A0A803N1U5_CHEQI
MAIVMDDQFLQNCIEDESGLVDRNGVAVGPKDEVGVGKEVGPENEDVGGPAQEVVKGEDDACAAALEALLKEVNVGEESYKTTTKGKSNVSISVEIEEFANLEVSLPPPPAVGMVFDS